MIKLLVDDSYAFEFYCILLVKQHFIGGSEIDKQVHECKNDLVQQIGEDKFSAVVSSDEFKLMFDVNCDTFKAVDLAKQNKLKASDVDKMTYKRKIAKDNLQRAHFSECNLEIKIGY